MLCFINNFRIQRLLFYKNRNKTEKVLEKYSHKHCQVPAIRVQ